MKVGEVPTSQRIRELRLSKNISQAELAAIAGMRPAQLCKIEAGRNGLNGSTIARIAEALDVSMAFLLGEDNTPGSSVKIRKAGGVRVKACEYVPVIRPVGPLDATDSVLKSVVDWERGVMTAEAKCGMCVQTSVQLVLPYGRDEQSAELAARDVRSSIGIGREPALNLAASLERAGVRIVMARGAYNFKSASYYNRARRTLSIALNGADTKERNNYELAYELGAAVAFAANGFESVEDAGAAHRFMRNFAAAFLMPEETVRAEVASLGIKPKGWTMESLVFVKERFGVSAEAFALRLEGLGLIAPPLRVKLRDELRERYASSPDDMEPHPPAVQTRLDVMQSAAES